MAFLFNKNDPKIMRSFFISQFNFIVRVCQFVLQQPHLQFSYKILEILSDRGCCYSGNIADEFPIALSTLSQHLKELKAAGLIQGEINPPFIKYCINQENWEISKCLFDVFLADKSLKTTKCNVG